MGAEVLSGQGPAEVQDLKAADPTAALPSPYLTTGADPAQVAATDYVLAGLGHAPLKLMTPFEQAAQQRTHYVLAGLAEVLGPETTGPETDLETAAAPAPAPAIAIDIPETPVRLEDIVAAAMAEGQSDEYLVALIDGLSAAGQLDAPAALLGPAGQVDTDLVLSALVRASRAVETRNTPAPRPAPGLEGPVVHTVRPGESLAAIAFRYYGETTRFSEIYEANRDQIARPDRIQVGQRLTIPAS